VVANNLFITGTIAGYGSRNWQKGTDKIATRKETDGNTSRVKSHTHTVEIRLKKSRQWKQGKSLFTKKDHLQRPWRISPKRFVMSARVYTGDGKTH
jgi:hypothetical protein